MPGRGVYRAAPIAPSYSSYYAGEYNGLGYWGTFDGNGHVISNLKIDDSDPDKEYGYAGLFGCLKETASVSNLRVENVNIVTVFMAGGLCGYNDCGTISNCYTTGAVTVERNSGGGICGVNFRGSINNCYSSCAVSVRYHAGGICGASGGLGAIVMNCFSTGSVAGEDRLGGLCGSNGNGEIRNCYALSTIYTNDLNDKNLNTAGGFVGTNNGIISNCFAASKAIGENGIGGFCGYLLNNPLNVSNCFWDVEFSGIYDYDIYDGMVGLTTEQMYDINSFLSLGWDFNAEAAKGTDDIWHMPYNTEGYPMLYWQRDIPGDLTGSYGVDVEDFSHLSENWQSESFIEDLAEIALNWMEGK